MNYQVDRRTISPNISDKYMYVIGFLGGLGILLLGSLFFILPLIFIGGVSENIEDMTWKIYEFQAYSACCAELLGIALSVIFFRKVLVKDFYEFLKSWPKIILIAIVSAILVYLSGYLFEYIYELFNIQSSSSNQETIELALFGKGKIIMILQVALIAPIFEELVFRKFCFGFLRESKLNRVLSFLIVAFIFALIHCSSEDFFKIDAYVYLLNYFALSAILCASYVIAKDNIFSSILVHMINNILSLLMVYGVINAFQLF